MCSARTEKGEMKMLNLEREGEGDIGALVVRYDDTCQCRICHEEETSMSMESPCACSGSLKYAHRSCVQRWCDEKGSTLCEICLQNLEPGYTVHPKKAQPDNVLVTIRGDLDVPRQNHEAVGVTNLRSYSYLECSPPPSASTNRAAACCRSLAIAFTALLLVRHLMDVLLIAADQYTLILFMLSLRATGILLPSFVVLRLISAIQHGQRQYQLEQIQLRRREEQFERSGSDGENPRQYSIQIHP